MDPENTSVLVLLVATNGETWLRDVIEGIRSQTHDELSVLAVDNASTDRSRALLERAFGPDNVVSLDRRVGYGRALAAALKVAADRGTSADAFLLLHDDAAMDPGSVEAMVSALGRDRVGIVGAKLVEFDAPETLQEVGLTTDRFGRLYNPLERGELDQGQHDGLKEVFFSSSTCLLVAREVVERIGLFDLRYVALRDDYDLCWRARIAGYRSVVTSDARVRHAAASSRELRPSFMSRRGRYFSDRNMIASLIKNYSLPHLLVALPVTLAISVLNTLVFLFTDRRPMARQTLAALQWNLVHLPSTVRGRARSQRRRRVRDREVVRFMVRGAPRVRSYVERALERVVGEPGEGIEEEGRDGSERTQRRFGEYLRRHPAGIAIVVLALLYLFGSRSLYGAGGLAGADLAPFPHGAGDFFREFFSGWRSAGTGSAAPASPFLLLAGVLSTLAFGSARLAERLLVLSLLPLAAGSAWRVAGALGLPVRARRVAAAAYALSPLALAAFFQGRFPELLLVASLPALIMPLLRASGFAPALGWRSIAAGALGTAAVATVSPWAPVALVLAGVLIAIGGLTAGQRTALGALPAGLIQSVGALVVLLPWSVELLLPGSPVGARPGPFGAPLTDIVRLVPAHPFPIPAPFAWAFPLTAAAGLVLALPERRRATHTLAIVGTLSVLVAWAVSRGVPWIAPRPGLPLVLAGLCVAMLAGIGAEGLISSLSGRSFGAAQVAFGAVAGFGVVAALTGVGMIAAGSFDGLGRSGALQPAFFQAETKSIGEFRVLWLAGSPRALRADLAPPDGETMLTFGARRSGPGQEYLERILASVLARRTEQAGRLLAPLGVRYVVLRPDADPRLAGAFARQIDFRFAQRFRGSQVIANEAWLSVATAVSSKEWIAASGSQPGPGPLASAPEDPGRTATLRRVRPGLLAGRTGTGATALLLAEEYNDRWRARLGDREVEPSRSFGWANAFDLTEGQGPVVLSWTGQGKHRLGLVLNALIIVVISTVWSRRSARERGQP